MPCAYSFLPLAGNPGSKELYSIRDYYAQIDGSEEEELEVMGFYAPELENEEKLGHFKGISPGSFFLYNKF